MNSNDKLNELLKKSRINGKELGQMVVNSLVDESATSPSTEDVQQAIRRLTRKQRRIYDEYRNLYLTITRFFNHYELWRMEAILQASNLCKNIKIIRLVETIHTLQPDETTLTTPDRITESTLKEKNLIGVRKHFVLSTRKLTSYNKIIELINEEYDVDIGELKKCCKPIIGDSITYSHHRKALIDELKQRKNQNTKIKILKQYFSPIVITVCTNEALAKAREMLKNRNTDLGDNIRDILAMLTDEQVLKS